jgi:hypothetical protein
MEYGQTAHNRTVYALQLRRGTRVSFVDEPSLFFSPMEYTAKNEFGLGISGVLIGSIFAIANGLSRPFQGQR